MATSRLEVVRGDLGRLLGAGALEEPEFFTVSLFKRISALGCYSRSVQVSISLLVWEKVRRKGEFGLSWVKLL